jgi:ferritin-like metal-binding protein YciE
MPIETLQDLLILQVGSLFSAEVQVSRAWPRLAKRAWHDRLANALWDLYPETETRFVRLEQIAEMLKMFPNGRSCQAMDRMLAEAEDRLREGGTPLVIDACLIASAQCVVSYKAAVYGSAKALAALAGLDSTADLLETSLLEERATLRRLDELAEAQVHPAALLGELIDGREMA